MGADFCLAIIPRCALTPKRLAQLKKAIKSDDDYIRNDKEIAIVLDKYASGELFNSREVTWISFKTGASYWVTGGMSWGDAPTDVYDSISMLDQFFDTMERWSIADHKAMKKT